MGMVRLLLAILTFFVSLVSFAAEAQVAVADSVTVISGRTSDIDVLANDNNGNPSQPLRLLSVSNAWYGSAAIATNAQGKSVVRYTSWGSYIGTESLTYMVIDGLGMLGTGTISINVIDPRPTAHPDTVHMFKGGFANIDVLANDTDGEPGPLALSVYSISRAPSAGSAYLMYDENGRTFIYYQPHPYFIGTDSFSYQMGDGGGQAFVGEVTIHVQDDTLIANADEVSMPMNSSITIDVLRNDVDPNPGPNNLFIASIQQQPTSGYFGLVYDENGYMQINYNPYPNFTGTDSFTYMLVDGSGQSAIGQVTVNVVNQAPIAGADSASISQGQIVRINVLANDSDPEGQSVSLVGVKTMPANGQVSIVYVSGVPHIEYRPNATYQASDSFTYEISDGIATSEGTVTINVAPDLPPVVVNDNYSITNKTSIVLNVLANDFDPEGQALKIISKSSAATGTLQIVNNGTAIKFFPKSRARGSDTFTYTVYDGRHQVIGRVYITYRN